MFFIFVVGNRDIVGPGFNNMANYIDHPLNPCPSIRFKENTPELLALKEKEKGDWKKLTVDEKKQCKLIVPIVSVYQYFLELFC